MIECNRRAYAGSVCETNNCRAHMNSVREEQSFSDYDTSTIYTWSAIGQLEQAAGCSHECSYSNASNAGLFCR